MLNDLESLHYSRQTIMHYIRNRGTRHLWDPGYQIRDEIGNLLPLRIQDKKTGKYINLHRYMEPLSRYPEFRRSRGSLINEDVNGWELDMPFQNESELRILIDLFLRKSRRGKESWPGAYSVPVLLIGESALEYASSLPQFEEVIKVNLSEGNNEISFIVHKKLENLRHSPFYEKLKNFGFIEELCLANKRFIKDIDTFK